MRSMRPKVVWLGLSIILCALLMTFANTPPVVADGPQERWIVVAKSDADLDALRADAIRLGGKILNEIRETHSLVVDAPATFKQQTQSNIHVQGVAKDLVLSLVTPNHLEELFNLKRNHQRIRIDLGKLFKRHKINPDPAFDLPGLMWNFARINASDAWRFSTGKPAVLVGVIDTGLDFTHTELKPQIANLVDLTGNENPPLCKTLTGFSDQDLATLYNGPATTDWNGHGSWIGGTIAAALDGQGINGIAPRVKLVSIKIAQWCGSAYTSTIVDAIRYAANHNIDIASISFDGYLDRTNPDHELIYQQMVQAVNYARRKGTLIVASASNEHLRIGANGQVISHGSLNIPGDPFVDYYGWWETPGGIPGVIMVSATNNIVNLPLPACPPGTDGTDPTIPATCKPTTDPHQPFGAGKQNQLAYYSNYGPRIDLAGPGGARKFNLPGYDRGGSFGYPTTLTDGFNDWADFGITSNFALGVPCFVNLGDGFPANQCYTVIQGTSMAVPHVSAMAALIASRVPIARHHPFLLEWILKIGALRIKGNTTPGLDPTDTSPGDLSGVSCPTAYCHLGGAPIPDQEAYGAGLVSAHLLANRKGHGDDDTLTLDDLLSNTDPPPAPAPTPIPTPTSAAGFIFLPMVGVPH